jgi:hypothetical protein
MGREAFFRVRSTLFLSGPGRLGKSRTIHTTGFVDLLPSVVSRTGLSDYPDV